MLSFSQPVILASASPRRRDLLQLICQNFTQHPADINESAIKGETASELVVRLANQKAQHVYKKMPNSIVIGSDTVIEYNERALGKPQDHQDFMHMLRMLSGNIHLVHTAVACISSIQSVCELVTTTVEFTEVSDDDAYMYWQSGEPADKAGGYAIQGIGGQFVKRINGSYSAVVGLPLCETKDMLLKMLETRI